MAMKDSSKDGYRLIQARAESSQAAISHQLADAISLIAHTATNALSAMSVIAKSELDLKSVPAPSPKKRSPRKS